MAKKKTSLEKSRERAEGAVRKTNAKIEELGRRSSVLYDALGELQGVFDKIRNVPTEKRSEHECMKRICLSWREQAKKIEKDYSTACVKNVGKGVAGAGTGVVVAALGPTAAMGVATTFGVASTGTAISALSGAAATNAALAWLGGGALAVGGGGMAAGQVFLALAGPVGWSIAGVALLGSGVFLFKDRADIKRLERVFELISKRDSKYYELAIVELEERISRIDEERARLGEALKKVASFGLDYDAMTESQQYELGTCVNLMNASTQLLVRPILGLQPRYAEEDFAEFSKIQPRLICSEKARMIIQLCNLLYKIELDEKDRKLFRKALRNNKDYLAQFDLKKSDFDETILRIVDSALSFKYRKDCSRK